ncbi:MAG: hypothetical protein HDR88_09105 [Bacteroides sp.]|nr:hypothetical protein [Bacteroides sp.]
MRNRILLGAGLSACAFAWAAKDPIIMTVNGVDVPKSEFEYLYHKNSQQQLAPQPLEEYVEMFKIYKLKVADAKANGLDTVTKFIKEMNQYRNELAVPYMADSTFLESLVKEAADRAQYDVEASHIMMIKTRDAAENIVLRNRLDSIRNVLLSDGDFTDLALRFSQDRSVVNNKGYMGFITSGRFPYEFETAAYTTPEGEISEVIESPAGYHIVKAGRKRPSVGKVDASHIMKMVPKTASEKENAAAKATIDSIYNIVKADPSKFAQLAATLSDDKGSARQGGKLPAFGSGEMVPEFEKVAFALNDGEISEPVKSQYGWHIIYRHAGIAPATAEQLKPEILRRAANPQDGRYKLVKDNRTKKLSEKHHASLNSSNIDIIISRAHENGVDSAFVASYTIEPLASLSLMMIDGKNIPASNLFEGLSKMKIENPDAASEALTQAINNFYARQLMHAEEDWLYVNNEDYRNLLNEYNDGSLLYEISLQKVWDKASNDNEGLQKYFDTHKGDYNWTEPHAKGFLVQATNDSVANLVRERLNSLPSDSIMLKARKEFSGVAQIDKVLVTKGTNPMVDNIMFGGPAVKPQSASYATYFMYEPRLLTSPESMDDVKGQVTSDYQNELETKWVEELKQAYPVKVNTKELKKIK